VFALGRNARDISVVGGPMRSIGLALCALFIDECVCGRRLAAVAAACSNHWDMLLQEAECIAVVTGSAVLDPKWWLALGAERIHVEMHWPA
jgi:hypothetical protein